MSVHFVFYYYVYVYINVYREVIWRREDGSAIDSSLETSEDIGVLRLPSVRSTDAGSYTCEVRAESGELARRTVRLEVHSKHIIF